MAEVNKSEREHGKKQTVKESIELTLDITTGLGHENDHSHKTRTRPFNFSSNKVTTKIVYKYV